MDLSERVLSAWFSSVADSGLTTIQKAAEDDCFVNVHFGGQPDVHFDKSRFAKVRICSNSASCWLLHSQDIAAVVTDFSYELIRSLIVESRSEWRPVRAKALRREVSLQVVVISSSRRNYR